MKSIHFTSFAWQVSMHNLLFLAHFMFTGMVNIKQGNSRLPKLVLPSGHNKATQIGPKILSRSYIQDWCHPWASCQIRKIAGAHAPGMPGTFSQPPRVSNPDMHHGTCVTHVPWCMPGSLTRVFLWIRRRGKTFPAFPAHAQPEILRIW